MTEAICLHVLKCGWYFIVFINLSAFVFAMPTVDDEVAPSALIEDKIETFKRDILKGLGYDKPPEINFTKTIDEKRRMIEEYRRYIEDRDRFNTDISDEYEEEEEEQSRISSKAFYSIDYRGGLPPSVREDNWMVTKAFRMYFPVSLSHPPTDPTRTLRIHSAQLKIFVNDVRPDELEDTLSVDKLIRVNAYQILSITNSTSYKRTLLDSKLLPLTEASYVNFEIAKAVQSWVNDKDSNLGIELAAESQDVRSVIGLDLSVPEQRGDASFNSTDKSPSIQVYARIEDLLKRVKRARRRNCRAGGGESRCCRYPIQISFEDIAWDSWIIAPREYQGFYCAGTCPYRHKMANNFVGIKALLHMQNPNLVPPPCCSATKLSPFTILHYNEQGKYVFSDYPDLVVRQCRCG